MNLKGWLKEPLVHFLLAGGALFLAASWIWPAPQDGRIITSGEEQLLEHLQARAQLYDEETFSALLANMSEEEVKQLVRDAAVSEALYREGQALGLAEADPLVKSRVIQQMRLLLMEEQAADVTVTEEDARAFYEAEKSRYAEGARASFSHVFFSNERRGERAAADAAQVLTELVSDEVPFSQAGRHGDRFLYQVNYAETGLPELAGQFGEEFAAMLFTLQPSDEWQGPLQSQFGWHLVGLRELSAERIPPFEEVAGRVAEDALAEERSRRAMVAIDDLMEGYDIREAGELAR